MGGKNLEHLGCFSKANTWITLLFKSQEKEHAELHCPLEPPPDALLILLAMKQLNSNYKTLLITQVFSILIL